MTIESDIPDSLPGLYIKTTLNNLQLDLDDYVSQLLFFGRKNANCATTISAHISADEANKAREVAHAINGVASTLGADDVSHAARDIELTIMNGSQVSSMQVEIFAEAMNITLDSINQLSELFKASNYSAEEKPDNNNHPFDIEHFRQQVRELDLLLSSNNFAAIVKLDEIISSSRDEEKILPLLKKMKEILIGLNFKEAKLILEKLISESV